MTERQSLPWRILGRALRPYALAVSVATFVLCVAVFRGVAVGQLLNGLPGFIIATTGVASALLLWIGWWAESEKFMRWGLFWSTGVWAAATMVMWLDVGFSSVSAMLAACWAIASGGAWLLEVSAQREDSP